MSVVHEENKSGPIEQMQTMLAGHFVAQSLHVVAVFGIADLIKKGHETADQIALAAGCHAPSSIAFCALWLAWVYSRAMLRVALD